AGMDFMCGTRIDSGPIDAVTRTAHEQEKMMVLRSIKELEFDHSMGKVSQADFDEINTRLRARALALMEQLEAAPVVAQEVAPAAPEPSGPAPCAACGAENDADARFCKACGTRMVEWRHICGAVRDSLRSSPCSHSTASCRFTRSR